MFLPSNITLQFGDSGDFVAELQRRLAVISLHSSDAINGFYDGPTVNSVTAFQSRAGIRADGVAGPETLRRLNGVIAGDDSGTSSTDTKQEEEAQLAAARNMLVQDQLAAAAQVAPPIVEPVLREEAPHVAATAAAAHRTPVSPAPEPSHSEQLQQQTQQLLQREGAQAQSAAPQSAGDLLAQMLLQHTQAQQSPQPSEQQAAQAKPMAAKLTDAPGTEASTKNPTVQKAASAEQSESATAPETAREQPKGMVSRAMQKMDALLQKMADYFEAKLPPDVLREVQAIGQNMMRSGVKESVIPSGPEQGLGQAPARGPEQQQQIQRG